MTNPLLAVVAVGVCAVALFAQTQPADKQPDPPAEQRPAEPPPAFDKYHFVLLVRADDPPTLPDDEARRLQGEHIGHLTAMGQQGHMLVAGPFAERFDERWRGLCLYDGTLSRDKVRELAEADPAVQAGTMKVEIMEWYTSKGALDFPMARSMRK